MDPTLRVRRRELAAIISAVRQHQRGVALGPRALRACVGAALAFVGSSLVIDGIRTVAPSLVPQGSGALVAPVLALLVAVWVLRRSPSGWCWAEEVGRLLADYAPADAGAFKAMLAELRHQASDEPMASYEKRRLEPVLRWALAEREALREAPRAPSAWERLLARRD